MSSPLNVGAQENNRRTIQATRGEYVAFCEGDDHWHSADKLALQVAYLQEHPTCILVHSGYELRFEDTGRYLRNALRVSKSWNDARAFEELLTGRRNVLTVTAVVRNRPLQRVLAEQPECSDPKYLMGDLQLWLELSRLGEVHCLPSSLATHNMLAESATHSANPDRELRFALSLRELVYHYLRKYPCGAVCERQATKWVSFFALSKASRAGKRDLTRELYREFSSVWGTFSPHAWLLYQASASRLARAVCAPLTAVYLALRQCVRVR